MQLLPCSYRRTVFQNGPAFECDHPCVYVDDRLVEEAICATCTYRENLGDSEPAFSKPQRVAISQPEVSAKTRKRVAFLAGTDFANITTQWAKAIREHSQLLEAASVCLRPHSFDYDLKHDFDLSPHRHSPGNGRAWDDLVTPDQLTAAREYLSQTDFIVQADELSSHELLELFQRLLGFDLGNLPPEKIVIYHAGTAFRNDWRNRNRRDEPFRAQLTHPDLYRLGGKNVRVAFPVLENIPADGEILAKFRGDRLIIVHSPSNQAVKGTAVIRRVVERVIQALPQRDVEYREISGGVANREVIAQKRSAHLHIDQFNDLGDRGVGGIGVSSIEAYSAGNLVLCSVNHILPAVWRAWGFERDRLPLVDLGTDEELFYHKLLETCALPNDKLAKLTIGNCQAAYASLQPRKIADYFESLFEVTAEEAAEEFIPAAPTIRRTSLRTVLVAPYWPSPGLFHKRSYADVLRRAFDAEAIAVEHEEGLLDRVMAFKPDLVVTLNIPLYRVYSERLIYELPRSVKLVTWHEDLRRQMHANLPAVLERSDAVISVLREAVLRQDQFPQLAGKLWRLPWFVPESMPRYGLHPNPLRRCLVPGANSRARPLRWRAVQEIPLHLATYLKHPGYGKASYVGDVVGKDFYDLIHRHACCLTDGGIYRYAVAKYVEVPYTGSLLLADDVPDLVEMGYRRGEHFIAVDDDTDLAALVDHVVNNLEDYEALRRAGQQLVVERHTERVRLAEACRMAREIRQFLDLA
jgi:hypothetical protein